MASDAPALRLTRERLPSPHHWLPDVELRYLPYLGAPTCWTVAWRVPLPCAPDTRMTTLEILLTEWNDGVSYATGKEVPIGLLRGPEAHANLRRIVELAENRFLFYVQQQLPRGRRPGEGGWYNGKSPREVAYQRFLESRRGRYVRAACGNCPGCHQLTAARERGRRTA